jgi:hypothetical protein
MPPLVREKLVCLWVQDLDAWSGRQDHLPLCFKLNVPNEPELTVLLSHFREV